MPTLDPQERIGKGFDRLSPIYDHVKSAVFSNDLDRFVLDSILQIDPSKRSRIWIVGGGTGSFVPELLQEEGVQKVFFSELSNRMIHKFRKRLDADHFVKVETHWGDVDTVPWSNIDLVVLPFILDCYPQNHIELLVKNVEQNMTAQGSLLVVDFSPSTSLNKPQPSWRRWFITMLYTFFGLTAKIPAKKLEDIPAILRNQDWKVTSEMNLYDGWIMAHAFNKPNQAEVTA